MSNENLNNPTNRNKQNKDKKEINFNFKFNLGWLYTLIIIALLGLWFTNENNIENKILPYDEFQQYVEEGYISKVIGYDDNSVEAFVKPQHVAKVFKADSTRIGQNPMITTEAPSRESLDSFLQKQKDEQHFDGSISYDKKKDYFTAFLWQILPFALLIGFWLFITRRMSGGNSSMGGGIFNVGKSKAQLFEKGSTTRVTFKDVAGLSEAKQEVEEIVEFLKEPQKYTQLGGKIPKGALLVGPPGTGKTLLAKAVAGEANVPFFSLAGSDFVEMFVGVGASRVRDLFETAKKNAPSIIFIDEIDAVGRKRGNGVSGGHDEREQTLNQLLVEMDGFEGDEGVIVMAATNRSDVLDPALLRPGRFDRKVLVGRPDVKGREAILKVHAKNKPLAPDVDLKEVARQTPGFVGADLENVLNEAALVAARRNKTEITASDIDEAEDRVIAGPAKKDTVISPEERKRVAYHEAGHAIVGLVLSDSRTVRKVTIVPRGRAGGYNIMLPKEDENIITKKQLMEQVAGLMGGRAGEEVVVGDKSTGASNDFEQATNIARGMVTQYGMTDVGMTELESPSMQSPYGTKPYSEATAAKIDEAVKEILDEGHKQAVDIIKSHRETHKIIAEALLKYETLNEKQILSLFKTGKMPENDENEFPSESKASTYEEAKAAMEKKDQQREETENKDDKEDIHPLPDDHKNIDNIPLNPPSEKNDSEDHSSDENKDD